MNTLRPADIVCDMPANYVRKLIKYVESLENNGIDGANFYRRDDLSEVCFFGIKPAGEPKRPPMKIPFSEFKDELDVYYNH